MAQGSTLFYLSKRPDLRCLRRFLPRPGRAAVSGRATAEGRQLPARPGGFIDVGRHAALNNLQSFTLEATVLPTVIAGDRRNILEAQTPAVALFIEPGGKLVGSVHTAQGWQGLDSGTTLVAERASTRVALRHDASGGMALSINGKVVASKDIPGPIINVGEAGFKIGN